MAAYIVAQVRVENPAAYEEYRSQVAPLVAKYGGRFLVRGGAMEVLEGTWDMPRLVILEFPDKATARAFYEAPEYQAILPLRTANAAGNLVLVEGA